MKNSEIKNLKIGTMLMYKGKEPFKITGLNTIKRDNGTLQQVTGIENNGLSYVYHLAKCSLSTDMSLMY